MAYGADLHTVDSWGELPIDFAEEMKQAILDEPRRRMDHGFKRATEQSHQKFVEGEMHLFGEETVDADEDQDSELSSDEEEC